MIDLADEPGHQELCDAEQAYMLRAIAEDIDLTRHMNDAVQSLADLPGRRRKHSDRAAGRPEGDVT